MPLQQPLLPDAASAVIRKVLRSGTVYFSEHGLEEMDDDGILQPDVVQTLVRGRVSEAYFRDGSWRHRVARGGVEVVVAIESDERLVVVTAWKR
jgi:hypothetical protein